MSDPAQGTQVADPAPTNPEPSATDPKKSSGDIATDSRKNFGSFIKNRRGQQGSGEASASNQDPKNLNKSGNGDPPPTPDPDTANPPASGQDGNKPPAGENKGDFPVIPKSYAGGKYDSPEKLEAGYTNLNSKMTSVAMENARLKAELEASRSRQNNEPSSASDLVVNLDEIDDQETKTAIQKIVSENTALKTKIGDIEKKIGNVEISNKITARTTNVANVFKELNVPENQKEDFAKYVSNHIRRFGKNPLEVAESYEVLLAHAESALDRLHREASVENTNRARREGEIAADKKKKSYVEQGNTVASQDKGNLTAEQKRQTRAGRIALRHRK